jgi:HEAT repeat protein
MSKYGGVLVLTIPIILAGCGKDEPKYKGKPAAYWIQALKGTDSQNRRDAITAAGALHIKTAVADLIAALNDGDDQIRAKAAEALWSLGTDSREAAPALAVLLRDRNAGVRLNAAGALGAIGPDAAAVGVAPLREALRDADPYVRAQAASSLGNLGPAAGSAAPELIVALKDRDKSVRAAAAYALAELGAAAREALPALNDAAQERNGDVRTAALYAAKKIQGNIK